MTHAVVTGAVVGRIPHGDGFIDVTPDVVYVESEEEAQAIAESIDVESAVRGVHPLQAECTHLDDPDAYPDGIPDDVREAHQAAHKALNEKAGI